MSKSRQQIYDPEESLHTKLPERIPIMPVKSTVLFPTGATGLQVGFAPNVAVLARYTDRNLVVGLVYSATDEMPIEPASLEKVGVLARILNRLNLPGGTIQTTVQGLIRIHLEDVRLEGDHYTAFPRLVEEVAIDEAEAERLIEKILTTLGGIGANVERLAEVPRILRSNLGDPGRFGDLVATLAHFSPDDKDEVLQRLDVGERLQFVLERLETEWERLRAREEGVPGERPGERRPVGDRASEIRKRIATLQAELGELDPAEKQAIEMLRRIERSQIPSRVAAVARQEAERLRAVAPSSADAADIRAYLGTVLTLPWEITSDAGEIDVDRVEAELNQKHVGLEEVKRRILEFLSVARLRENLVGPIPCIVGPPEVGKRSLAAAVARGLRRPLVRLDLGGRGEAALVGTRRTRSGARPGKIIEGYREAGVRDPVYLLEEIDLIGLGNVEGDPIEALEEVLDPDYRSQFLDRYLDIPFDMSDTIFIATANDFFRIPRNLREFLIEIRIAGYTPEEKVEIARQRLLPKLIAEHGLEPNEVELEKDTLSFLTRGYARDSGLGNLRRSLGAILRYVAHEKTRGNSKQWTLSRNLVEEILGIPRYPTTEAESAPEIGVVTGLAWTASGGELMFIEALKMPGTGRLIITGMLGEVMKESVNAAYSYVRSRAEMIGIPKNVFSEHDIHIHFPVGATPKDGPSAGAAVTLAVASTLSDRCVRHDVAMTGEVTLRGKILEIGGVKEKILAAYRAGLREVILPVGNERDLRDVPSDVRDNIKFHFVQHMDEVFRIALLDHPARTKPKKASKTGTGATKRKSRGTLATRDSPKSTKSNDATKNSSGGKRGKKGNDQPGRTRKPVAARTRHQDV